MFREFEEKLEKRFKFLRNKRILVACSGGVDSVTLAHLCHQIGLDITLVHCNFHLRGPESDADEKFVKSLATKMHIDFLCKSFDVDAYLAEHGGSVQMAARALRYKWFNSLLENEGYDYLLTAHHADDDLETFLINLSRGTGIEGLTGIPEQNQNVVRPLLEFSRSDIEMYARTENLDWREDSSNSDNKYLRNKIRLELVSKLKELHPTFLANFASTQDFLNQTRTLAEQHIFGIRQRLFQPNDNGWSIPIDGLKQLEPIDTYLYGLFGEFGFMEWDNVRELLDAMSGKEIYSKTHRLLKDRTHLILSPVESNGPDFFYVQEEEKMIWEPIHLKMETVAKMDKSSPNHVYLDKEKLNFPLVLRKWKKGDYFYPFGMKGKKKLSKFFKDEKVDVISKEKQWLLCSDDEIVWVIGRRADERFKLEPTTKQILKLTYSL